MGDPTRNTVRDAGRSGISNYELFSFKAEMTNRTTGAHYELDSLSSGERVLMALCLASFNQDLGRRCPKLLLLDELDTVLHPSMVAALVTTLKTLFVSRGTKVLMTSHSAMTVAALDEADIFRVVRTGSHVNVSRTTKSEAIDELSEGLASIDGGLKIAAYDEARVTILTEGHNAKHLKRWVELNFPEDVRVFEGLEQHSNDTQLLAYGRLLARMNTDTHFVVVWDCDAAGKAEALRRELSGDAKITPYAFAKRLDNRIADKGIENNYDEEILEPYSTTTTGSDGTLLGPRFPEQSQDRVCQPRPAMRYVSVLHQFPRHSRHRQWDHRTTLPKCVGALADLGEGRESCLASSRVALGLCLTVPLLSKHSQIDKREAAAPACLAHSLYRDLPSKSSQYSTLRPTSVANR